MSGTAGCATIAASRCEEVRMRRYGPDRDYYHEKVDAELEREAEDEVREARAANRSGAMQEVPAARQ